MRFIKFGFVGLVSTLVDFEVYLRFVEFGATYTYAKFFSYVAGIFVSYLGNSFFTFRGRRVRLLKFLVAYGFGLLINVTSNDLLIIAFHASHIFNFRIIWIIATFLSALTNFLILNSWAFIEK
jgi:putative flippase GtrA